MDFHRPAQSEGGTDSEVNSKCKNQISKLRCACGVDFDAISFCILHCHFDFYIFILRMIIILHGENSFLTKRKRDEIIARYRAKHPHGLSYFACENGSFDDFRSAAETASLFDAKKLIACREMLGEIKTASPLIAFLRARKIKEDKDIVVVFSESAPLSAVKNKEIQWLFEAPSVVQESKVIALAHMPAWVRGEVSRLGGAIDDNALPFLLSASGGDLWRLSAELAKLLAYDAHISKETVALLVAQTAEGEIFAGVAALARRDAKTALSHFSALLKDGEDWTRIFAMIVFQFRGMIKVKSLLDAGCAGPALQKRAGMHPFALAKTIPYARTYTMEELKRMYITLWETDVALKTGSISFEAAAENMALGI